MTDQQQYERAVAQKKAIEDYAVDKGVDVETAFFMWVDSGMAQSWADNYDKGEV